MREFTPRAVLVGAVLGMVFGASSLYLTLKVGLTVSASIPVAVISLALFRSLSKFGVRDATILEHNITQTAGSAGESLAFGVGVTMPAIMILGFDLQVSLVLLVAALGGLLGIMMMIPLRRALIVAEHETLKYPEGTACAAVLRAGARAEDRVSAGAASGANAEGAAESAGGRVIFWGFAIGLFYKVCNVALKGWREVPEKLFGVPLRGASIGAEISPELLGVGYIIGPRIAAIMCAGGVMAYLVIIPLVTFFGQHVSAVIAPGSLPIDRMAPEDIRSAYVLYIGAGAVTAGGIISLARSLPTIWRGLKAGLRDVGKAKNQLQNKLASAGGPAGVLRTDRDLSLKFVGIGIIILVAGITAAPVLHMNLLGALLITAFGFLFVTVSSRLTGEIGSSSNPVSGMTVATLLLTCLIFLAVGWTGGGYYVTALSVGAVVCIAASNGGSTSQDLKTGYLLGATPRWQQLAIMIGALGSAVILGPILLVLNNAATVYVPIAQVAPAGLHTDTKALTQHEKIAGPQAASDTHDYLVWQKTDTAGGPPGRYLVNAKGEAVWLVDPGINGHYTTRPDGTEVRKFDAPKAVLMSYIIKGILGHQLPWALVLLGVMIAVVLEMCGIPSLAFAVGLYLPLSASTPILCGGMVRGLVNRHMRRKLRHARLSEAELTEASDKSPGVLLSSGYIAGGAIAGIVIAILQGVTEHFDEGMTRWADAHNPLYHGAYSNLLSLLPFALLCGLLYLAGRRGGRREGRAA